MSELLAAVHVPEDAGEPVSFVAGKYGGLKGWLYGTDAGNDTVAVIVNRGKKKGLKYTYVYRSSVIKESEREPDESYAEAAIRQCPDIEKSLVYVCRLLAKCDIQRDPDGLYAAFARRIDEATIWQESKGSKAEYRWIEYDSDNDGGSLKTSKATKK